MLWCEPLHLLNITREWLRVSYPKSEVWQYFDEDKDFLNAIKLMAEWVYEESGYLKALAGFFNEGHWSALTKISDNVSKSRIINELLERANG